MSLGPFDLTGGPFLILYMLLLIATVAIGLVPMPVETFSPVRRIRSLARPTSSSSGRSAPSPRCGGCR